MKDIYLIAVKYKDKDEIVEGYYADRALSKSFYYYSGYYHSYYISTEINSRVLKFSSLNKAKKILKENYKFVNGSLKFVKTVQDKLEIVDWAENDKIVGLPYILKLTCEKVYELKLFTVNIEGNKNGI